MELKIGDKVTCIDATGYLVKNEVYTVKGIFGTPSGNRSIIVNECSVNKGYGSYKLDRFEKVKLPNLISVTDDDLETMIDAFIALDYYSEGTYVNIANCGKLIDRIESQVRESID